MNVPAHPLERVFDEAFESVVAPAFAAIVSLSYLDDPRAAVRLYLIGRGWSEEEFEELDASRRPLQSQHAGSVPARRSVSVGMVGVNVTAAGAPSSSTWRGSKVARNLQRLLGACGACAHLNDGETP